MLPPWHCGLFLSVGRRSRALRGRRSRGCCDMDHLLRRMIKSGLRLLPAASAGTPPWRSGRHRQSLAVGMVAGLLLAGLTAPAPAVALGVGPRMPDSANRSTAPRPSAAAVATHPFRTGDHTKLPPVV